MGAVTEPEPERDDGIARSLQDKARLEGTGLTPPDADKKEEKDVDPKTGLGGGYLMSETNTKRNWDRAERKHIYESAST